MHRARYNISRGGGGQVPPLAHACGRPCLFVDTSDVEQIDLQLSTRIAGDI